MSKFGVQSHLSTTVCNSVEEAVDKGYVYTDGTYKAVQIAEVVVVRNGMDSGKPSVDFILHDEEGNKYVVMLSGALMKSIPCGA